MEDDCPCDSCPRADWCDGWEAKFCCQYLGGGDCEDCDPMDI